MGDARGGNLLEHLYSRSSHCQPRPFFRRGGVTLRLDMKDLAAGRAADRGMQGVVRHCHAGLTVAAGHEHHGRVQAGAGKGVRIGGLGWRPVKAIPRPAEVGLLLPGAPTPKRAFEGQGWPTMGEASPYLLHRAPRFSSCGQAARTSSCQLYSRWPGWNWLPMSAPTRMTWFWARVTAT